MATGRPSSAAVKRLQYAQGDTTSYWPSWVPQTKTLGARIYGRRLEVARAPKEAASPPSAYPPRSLHLPIGVTEDSLSH